MFDTHDKVAATGTGVVGTGAVLSAVTMNEAVIVITIICGIMQMLILFPKLIQAYDDVAARFRKKRKARKGL